MTAQLEQQSPGHWCITGVLSFDTVPALSERVEALFADGTRLDLDLRDVQRADSAGVALLVEWAGEAQRRAVEIRYLNVPAQMLAIARVTSIDQILPLGRA